MMGRRERRGFEVLDEIARLRGTLTQVHAEIGVLEHLHDDAVRDASVGGPIDREDARESARDVARLRRLAADLAGQIERLELKHRRLLG